MKFGDYLQDAIEGDQLVKQSEKFTRIKQGRVILLRNPDRKNNESYFEQDDSSSQFFEQDSFPSKFPPQPYMYLSEKFFDENVSEIELADSKSNFLYKDSPMPSFDKKSKSSKLKKHLGNSLDFV